MGRECPYFEAEEGVESKAKRSRKRLGR